MLTYSLYDTTTGSGKGKSWDELTTNEKVVLVVTLVLILVLIIWAYVRAMHCSNNNPDSRAIHLLFATVDPVLYLIFSYFLEGMCQ